MSGTAEKKQSLIRRFIPELLCSICSMKKIGPVFPTTLRYLKKMFLTPHLQNLKNC